MELATMMFQDLRTDRPQLLLGPQGQKHFESVVDLVKGTMEEYEEKIDVRKCSTEKGHMNSASSRTVLSLVAAEKLYKLMVEEKFKLRNTEQFNGLT